MMDARPSAELASAWTLGDRDAVNLLLAHAAAGEVEAQRLLAQGMAEDGQAGEPQSEQCLAGAELFARMAASHGTPADLRRLAGILSLQAARCRSLGMDEHATSLEAECLVILTMLADEGFEEAAEAMSTFAETFSREAVEAAQADVRTAKAAVAVIAAAPLAPEPSPPPLDCLEAGATRWDRFKLICENRFWCIRFYFESLFYALASLGRALIGRD